MNDISRNYLKYPTLAPLPQGLSISGLQPEEEYHRAHELFVLGSRVKALVIYTRLAELGYPKAQTNLGICYMDGFGVEKDPATAAAWFRKAADQGHEKALNELKRH